MKILFLCGRAQIRSPTAEQLFHDPPAVETRSAGVSADADYVVSADDVDWTDVIACMERTHADKLKRQFGKRLGQKRVVVLGIQDEYDFMSEDLVSVLRERVPARVMRP